MIMQQLKDGMISIDWSKVKGAQLRHARCTVSECGSQAIYMRKSKNRWGEYYRIYCRYHAHK